MTYDEFKQNFLPEFLNINSYAGRMRYADERLQRIGSGSGRRVYDIDGKKVLKLAMNAKGVAQNSVEAGTGYYRDTQHIVTEVFDSSDDDTWLISEKAKKVTKKRIEELEGIPSFERMAEFLVNFERGNNRSRYPYYRETKFTKEENDFFWKNEFSSALLNFIGSYGQAAGDMTRPSSYGEVLRDGQPSIVLTDYGMNDDVVDTYYSRKNVRERYQIHELFNYADGNDDILSDAGGGNDIRTGMWALTPYDVGDGDGVINENFVKFVNERESYPDTTVNGISVLTDAFHECKNNIKQVLSLVENKEQFYGNLLKLQEYLIRRGFYNHEPLISEEYFINENETPDVEYASMNDKGYANELAKQIAVKLELTAPRYLGGGGFGHAFEINDNLILKITSDMGEADAGLRLTRANPKHLGKVFNVYKVFDTQENKSYFALLEENINDKPIERFRKYEANINKIKPNDMDYGDILIAIKKPKRFNRDEMQEFAKHVLTDNPEAGVGEADRQAAYEFLLGVFDIRQELLDYGIKSTDYISMENLGYKNGVLKFFDIGGHIVPQPDIDDSKTIQLPEDGSAKFTTANAINQDEFPPYETNDTSPMINNDLDANIAMYEDLEYNHVDGDATQDEYKLEERKKDWVSGSKAVEVKKKCRLGGKGDGTSVACNQGDMSNLKLTPLEEIIDLEIQEYFSSLVPKVDEPMNEDNNIEKDFPLINGDTISGLRIKNEIPNMGSIDASLTDYEVLDGIREVSFSKSFPHYPRDPKQYSVDEYERTRELAQQIKINKEISPLIIVVDNEGPYVLEGGHRFDALRTLGIDLFPAKIVLDLESLNDEPKMLNEDIMTLQDLPFRKEVEQLGGKIFSVGGAVRDEFLGKQSKDLDILVTGIPMDKLAEIMSPYGKVDAVGQQFGVLKFRPQGASEEIDVAIPRTEKATGAGGHKGFDVASDHMLPIEKDLERRDFTINAIAKDIDGNIIDPYNGQEDLKNKIIRIVNPDAFSDDPLRMLRAVQFASRFGFTIEPKTMQMIADNANKIKEIAPERILIELDKIVTKGNARIGIELLASTGLFKQIFGNEIQPSQIGRRNFEGVRTMAELLFLMMNGVVQNPAEFYLSRFATDDAKRDKIYKELQALELAFNSDLVDQQMTPVKARSVAHNMYTTASQTLESQVIPEIIRNAGQELLQGKYPKTVNELAVNGNDLMNAGLRGKAIGDMQKAMLIRIYADNIRNNKEELLSLVKEKNDVQEGYHDMQPKTWNVNGKQVTIDYFIQAYDKWNHQGGKAGYPDASRESVLEFLQNNYEDESADEKLRKELYWALTDRDLLGEEVDRTEKVEYGALMLSLDIPQWKKITSVIKKDDIYEVDNEFGIETEPHVTILYGFHSKVNANDVFNTYKENFELKPIEISVEGISIFENEEFDVVKMDVSSKVLTKMNKVMRELPNTSTHPKYHAHITIAYVKKGRGKDYVKKFEKNQILVGNELVFSTKNEKKNKLKLGQKDLLKEEVKGFVLNEIKCFFNERKSEYTETKESLMKSKSIGKEMKEEILKYLTSESKYHEGGRVTSLKKPKELMEKSNKSDGVSMGADKNGFFIYTHRARSKSHLTPDKITVKEISFIDSTG